MAVDNMSREGSMILLVNQHMLFFFPCSKYIFRFPQPKARPVVKWLE